MRKRTTVVEADAWLDGLIHRSPAFQARVEEDLAAINIAQDLVALRELRGLSQVQLAERLRVTQSAIAQLESAQPKNVELRTLVRVAAALGGHVDVSIRPRRQAEQKSRQRRLKVKRPAAARSPA
jgi:predicted XRE-type DNA-binding protein